MAGLSTGQGLWGGTTGLSTGTGLSAGNGLSGGGGAVSNFLLTNDAASQVLTDDAGAQQLTSQ